MLTFAFPFLLTNLVVLDYKTLVLLLVKNTNAAFMLVVEVSVSSSTSEDVQKVIMAMPSNKAPGYDRIPVFVIKDCLVIHDKPDTVRCCVGCTIYLIRKERFFKSHLVATLHLTLCHAN